MFKYPRDVEVAILVAVNELKHTEEHNLDVGQNTVNGPSTDQPLKSHKK